MDRTEDSERQAIVARIAAAVPFSQAQAELCTTTELRRIAESIEAERARYARLGFKDAASAG